QVDGSIVATQQDNVDHADEFLSGECASGEPLHGSRHHMGDQVGARRCAACCDLLKEIVLELYHLAGTLQIPRVADEGATHALNTGVTPELHLGYVFLRQGHQPGNDVEREGAGKLTDKLYLARANPGVDQTVGNLL